MVQGRLLLSLERPARAADVHRLVAQQMVLQPLLTFTAGEQQPQAKLEVSIVETKDQIAFSRQNIECKVSHELTFITKH